MQRLLRKVIRMADMKDFGAMDVEDRGGEHDYLYKDAKHIQPSEGLTPSQTVGPFFAYGLTPGPYGYPLPEIHKTNLAGDDIEGMPIKVEGQIFDGGGNTVHDAFVELIQADHKGHYASPERNDAFTGFGRMGTGANGAKGDTRFIFETIKPGITQEDAAPSLTLVIFMRGLLNHCITRVYFEGDDLSSDPILAQVPEARRDTLIAKEIKPNHFRFDIYMQGDNETVFFDI